SAKPLCNMPVHLWRRLVHFYLVDTDKALEILLELCSLHDCVEHRWTAVGEDDHRVACLFQALKSWLDIGKSFQVVVLGHERILLICIELLSGHGKRVVERLARNLFKVFILLHDSQPERELELLLSPHLSDALCLSCITRITWNKLFKLLPDTE